MCQISIAFRDRCLDTMRFSTSRSITCRRNTVSRDFVVDDAMLQQFKDFLKANQIDFTDADIVGSLDWVKSNIKAELFTSQFGQLEGLKVRAQTDPEINKAATYMPEAMALVDRDKSQQKTASLVH